MTREHLAIVALIAISSAAGSLVTSRIVTAQAATAQSVRRGDDGNTTKWEYRVVQAGADDVDKTVSDLAGQGFALFKFQVTVFGGDFGYPLYHIVFRLPAAQQVCRQREVRSG